MKRTAGPWEFRGYCVYPPKIKGEQTEAICQMWTHNSNREADAHLIAAAPEMLEILEELKNEFMSIGAHPLHDKAIQIIKKAKGEL